MNSYEFVRLPAERQAELLAGALAKLLAKSRGRVVHVPGNRLFRLADIDGSVPPTHRTAMYHCLFELLGKQGNTICVDGAKWYFAGVYERKQRWRLRFVRLE